MEEELAGFKTVVETVMEEFEKGVAIKDESNGHC